MANEEYQKIIDKMSEGLDESGKKKIEEALNLGYKVGVNTLSHNFGEVMQNALYVYELYIQNPTGEDTKKCMSNQRKSINNLSRLISMLLNTDIKNTKMEEYPTKNSGNYIINTDEIMNENGEQNGK